MPSHGGYDHRGIQVAQQGSEVASSGDDSGAGGSFRGDDISRWGKVR